MAIIWIKPSGLEFKTNDLDATIAYCESLGYKRKDAKKPAKKTAKKK